MRHQTLLLSSVLGLAACGGGSSGGTTPMTNGAAGSTSSSMPMAQVVDCTSGTPAATVQVMLPNFSPAATSVKAGDIVAFQNSDSTAHTATSGTFPSGDGKWDTGNIAAGATICVKFQAGASGSYFCKYHQQMSAMLTVE